MGSEGGAEVKPTIFRIGDVVVPDVQEEDERMVLMDVQDDTLMHGTRTSVLQWEHELNRSRDSYHWGRQIRTGEVLGDAGPLLPVTKCGLMWAPLPKRPRRGITRKK